MKRSRFRWYWLTEIEVIAAVAVLAGDVIGAALGDEGTMRRIAFAGVVAGLVLLRETVRDAVSRNVASALVAPPAWFRVMWIVIIVLLACRG
jgi:hypothetical protein